MSILAWGGRFAVGIEHQMEHDAFTLKARDLKRRIERKGFVLPP